MQIAEKAYDEMIELFARGSTPREILQFQPSPATQERARYLLERRKLDQLTSEESAELDRLGELEHLMQLVKARARSYADRSP